MRHNDMLDLLRRCLCPCHPTNRLPIGDDLACWCRSRTPADDGLALHHNDRIRFGGCTCPHHRGGPDCCCGGPTSADLSAALQRLSGRDRQRPWYGHRSGPHQPQLR